MNQTRASQKRAPVGVTGSYTSEKEKERSVGAPRHSLCSMANVTTSGAARHQSGSSHGRNVVMRAWLAFAVK